MEPIQIKTELRNVSWKSCFKCLPVGLWTPAVYSLHPLAFPKSWLLLKRVPRKVHVGKLWGHTFGREVFRKYQGGCLEGGYFSKMMCPCLAVCVCMFTLASFLKLFPIEMKIISGQGPRGLERNTFEIFLAFEKMSSFLDLRFSGFLACWISGFLDFWFSGFLVFWTSAFLDFWFSGFLVFLIYGFLGFCFSGFLVFWFSGFLVFWTSGFLDFCFSGFLLFWFPGFLLFWISGFLLFWFSGFLVFWAAEFQKK